MFVYVSCTNEVPFFLILKKILIEFLILFIYVSRKIKVKNNQFFYFLRSKQEVVFPRSRTSRRGKILLLYISHYFFHTIIIFSLKLLKTITLPPLILFLFISLIIILLNKILLYLSHLNNLINFNFNKKYLYNYI